MYQPSVYLHCHLKLEEVDAFSQSSSVLQSIINLLVVYALVFVLLSLRVLCCHLQDNVVIRLED